MFLFRNKKIIFELSITPTLIWSSNAPLNRLMKYTPTLLKMEGYTLMFFCHIFLRETTFLTSCLLPLPKGIVERAEK